MFQHSIRRFVERFHVDSSHCTISYRPSCLNLNSVNPCELMLKVERLPVTIQREEKVGEIKMKRRESDVHAHEHVVELLHLDCVNGIFKKCKHL